jgi:hypothetical protein
VGEQALARIVAGALFVLSVRRAALGSSNGEVLAAGEGLLGMCRGLGLRVPKAPADGDGTFVSKLGLGRSALARISAKSLWLPVLWQGEFIRAIAAI